MTCIREPNEIAEEFDWSDVHYLNLNDELVCPICRSALTDPLCTDCGHTFCSACIKCLVTENNVLVCPIDRTQIDAHPHQAPYLVKHLLDELNVRCPYSTRGCTFEGKRWLLNSHVQTDCQYVKVYCHAPCSNQIERRLFNESGCGCGEGNLPKVETQTTPPETDHQICDGEQFGCTFTTFNSTEFNNHQTTCQLAKIALVLKTHQNENKELKHKMEILSTASKKSHNMLDASILAEYDRIIHELRVTQNCQQQQHSMISALRAENNKLNQDMTHLVQIVDGMRRQLFHFTQQQRIHKKPDDCAKQKL